MTHGIPIITELPKKISANDSPIDRLDAPAVQPLRRMLARRAAAEVRVHDQHRRALILRDVERMAVVRPDRGFAIVLEDVLLEPVEGDARRGSAPA